MHLQGKPSVNSKMFFYRDCSLLARIVSLLIFCKTRTCFYQGGQFQTFFHSNLLILVLLFFAFATLQSFGVLVLLISWDSGRAGGGFFKKHFLSTKEPKNNVDFWLTLQGLVFFCKILLKFF